MLPISIFAKDEGLLNLGETLLPKQCEILDSLGQQDYDTAILCLGRRSGKTFMAAIAAVYSGMRLADEYKKYLRQGEKFYIVAVANSLDQAAIILGYIETLLKESPTLRKEIRRQSSTEIELRNGCIFRTLPTSSRGGRGLACPLIIFDELAHSVDSEEGNTGGVALYNALRPSLAQFGRLGKVLMLSSPWIKGGLFWETYEKAQNGASGIKVIQAPTWEIRTDFDPQFFETEKERLGEAFAVEYGANFSESIAAFLSSDVITAAICDRGGLGYVDRDTRHVKVGTRTDIHGLSHNLSESRTRTSGYYLALDPAKGGRDDYTACIGHYERRESPDGEMKLVFVVDLWHRFEPTFGEGKKKQVDIKKVHSWIADMNKQYRFTKIVLDQFNSQATVQAFEGYGTVEEQNWTQPSKMAAYAKMRDLFNSSQMEIPLHPQSIKQLRNLQIIRNPNGTWNVTGGNGAAVDDYASALAGAVLIAERVDKFPPKIPSRIIWSR